MSHRELDYRLMFEGLMEDCLRRRVGPSIAPETWERIREEMDAAYRQGHLSDAEHDDLLNVWVGWTGGLVGERT